jgi:hypothetical protein
MVSKIQNSLYSIHHAENCFKQNANININNFSYVNLMYEDRFKENLCWRSYAGQIKNHNTFWKYTSVLTTIRNF